MRFLLLICTLGACGAGDDTTEGARGACSRGGALESCPVIDHSATAACTRLVQCGAIPLSKTGEFDWAACVDAVDGELQASKDLVIDCIAATSCDLLRPNDKGQIACLRIGGQ